MVFFIWPKTGVSNDSFSRLFVFFFRFCVCMLHEQFVRYLNALHKVYLAHHDSNCACDCLFCESCGEIERFNVSWFMRHMLCTPLLRFPGSTIRLYSWDCIENKCSFFWLIQFVSTCLNTNFPFCFVFARCVLCHENKSGTIFECPSSGLLDNTDEIEFEVYSEVDLTRQSLSACATGTTMKGTLSYLIPFFLLVHMQIKYTCMFF